MEKFRIDCRGILTIKRSEYIEKNINPNEDLIDWLFLSIDGKFLNFCYHIIYPEKACYESPFEIEISFLDEKTINIVSNNFSYDVYRGDEFIGKLKIIR